MRRLAFKSLALVLKKAPNRLRTRCPMDGTMQKKSLVMVYKLEVFSCQVVLFQRITRLKHHPGLSSARFSQNKWFFLGRKNKHSSSKFVSFFHWMEWNEWFFIFGHKTSHSIGKPNLELKKDPPMRKNHFSFSSGRSSCSSAVEQTPREQKKLQGCGFYSSRMLGFFSLLSISVLRP